MRPADLPAPVWWGYMAGIYRQQTRAAVQRARECQFDDIRSDIVRHARRAHHEFLQCMKNAQRTV